VVFTTRPIKEVDDVSEEFQNLVFDIRTQDLTTGVEKMINVDVAKFVQGRCLRPEIEDLIKPDLKTKAGPMFQWVWSVIQGLREVPTSTNALEVFKAELEKYIPSDIENPYMETIKTIEKSTTLMEDDKSLIASLLRFLVFAEMDVDLEDLRYALASLKFYGTAEELLNLLPQNLGFLLQSSCSTLVIVENGIVRLAHLSVKTFLF
jgi:hypothetical protein